MRPGDLSIVFALQDRLTQIQRAIEPKNQGIYDAFPEVISIFPASDHFKRDENDYPIVKADVIHTCRIRVEVMKETPGLQEKLAAHFPGIPVEIVESDLEEGKQELGRLLARHSDRLSNAIEGGYYIGVERDERGAYFNMGLNRDTAAARKAVQNIFPGERIVFMKDAPRLTLGPG